MKNLSVVKLFLSILVILLNINNPVFAKITNQEIPDAIYQLATKIDSNYQPVYIMDWNNKKVFRLKHPNGREVRFWTPDHYLLYDNKIARETIEGESWLLKFYIVNYKQSEEFKQREKLFEKNLNKFINKKFYLTNKIEFDNNQIPSVIKDYTNKYIIKGEKKTIIFITKWNNYYIYKVNWSLEEETFSRGSFILFDGNIIRRPTIKEFQELQKTLKFAYINYY